MSAFIGKFPNSLIVYDGADDISLDFLTEKCAFHNSDIVITTQNSNIDLDEFSVIPIDTFTPEEAESFLMIYSNKRKQTEHDTEIIASGKGISLSRSLRHIDSKTFAPKLSPIAMIFLSFRTVETRFTYAVQHSSCTEG